MTEILVVAFDIRAREYRASTGKHSAHLYRQVESMLFGLGFMRIQRSVFIAEGLNWINAQFLKRMFSSITGYPCFFASFVCFEGSSRISLI